MARKKKRIMFWKWGFYINLTGRKYHIKNMPKRRVKIVRELGEGKS